MLDRRRSHRLDVELQAYYQRTDAPADFLTATTLNVNATGMCIIANEELEADQEVLIKVKLPTEQKIDIKATVIWINKITSNKCKAGVKIMEPMTSDEAEFVKFYAKKFMKEFKK